MRKRLLASVAVLTGLAGAAQAQMVTTQALTSGASAPNGSSSFPNPGTVVIRFGGAMDWYAAAVSDSGDHNTAQVAGGGAATTDRFKKASYTFGDYLRLYPTIDGVAANGLRYGVYSELRVEQPLNTGGGQFAGVSATDRASTLYVRRAYGYVGLARAGYLRFGTGDGAGGLFDTGTFQNFDQGGWDGDVSNLPTSNAQPTFPFQGGVGAFYATDKLTYLSPQVYGLEFGLSYEPNTSNITDYDGASNFGSIRLSGSSATGDLKRRRNVINPELRFRQTIGPIGVALEAGYLKSAATGYDGVATSAVQRYKGWDWSDWGAVLTYGGLSVGGHAMTGAFNGQGGLAPQGAHSSFAYLGGASYTVGPVIVGASFFQYNSPGNSGSTPALQGTATLSPVGQLRERGFAAGGTYTALPGVSLFLSALWGERKENGYDLLNGAQSIRGSTQGNNTRASALGFGTQIRW